MKAFSIQHSAFSIQRIRLILFLCLIFFNFFSEMAFSQGATSGVSISWNVSVGCQTYQNEGDGTDPILLEDISDSQCIKVCEGSDVTYTLTSTNPITNVVWTVVGGTVTTTATTCNVHWGTTGAGSLSFTASTATSVITKTICFEKIIKPTALFNVVPTIEGNSPILTCTQQTIYFTNQSTANNGTNLISYYWDFGDGSYSTAFEPTHIYTQNGEFNVSLYVTNACNCQSSYRRKIIVGPGGFDISCPGVVCDGQKVTYSLPAELYVGECNNEEHWTVTGGTLSSIQNNNVTVTWNNVNATGFGYLTFNPDRCAVRCQNLTTIKIPVIQTVGTITGNTNICLKDEVVYKMPQWPTTDFHWEIVGNPAMATITLSDQRNEVIIKPLQSGALTLRCTYQNTLLHCGGSATIDINVSEPVIFDGNLNICLGNTGVYATADGSTTNWSLVNETNTVINTLANSSTYSYNFTLAGVYTLSTTSLGLTCLSASKKITVFDVPPAPIANNIKVALPNGATVLASSLAVCPNAAYTYSVSGNLGMYNWSVTNGTIIGSNITDQVAIKFNGSAPATITVFKIGDCNSLPTTITIPIKQIIASISPATSNSCANSIANYQANNAAGSIYTTGENYVWSISPPAAGSITTGQGTAAISVLWNNTAVQINATVKLTIKECTITQDITPAAVSVTPLPNIIITPNPANGIICSGSPITFTLSSTTTGVTIPANANVTWNYGYGDVPNGTINGSYTYTNITTANIGKTVTATIINPNGCNGNTNVAQTTITIKQGPPASASLNTQVNGFCTQAQISATMTASTSVGSTIQWYNNGMLLVGQTGSTINIVPSMGFGAYYFIATNTAGCKTQSNSDYISQSCGTVSCNVAPVPVLSNNATPACGAVNLSGTATGTPVGTPYWKIVGPGTFLFPYSGTSFAATQAGVYDTYYFRDYTSTTGGTCALSKYKKITIPYIPDFAYTVVCNGNNSFNINLIDKSSIFALVTSPTIKFNYRLVPTTANPNPAWILVTGTTISNLPQGNYQVKVVVQGTLNNALQPACEKIVTPITMQTVPNQSITNTPPNCYDTAVGFGLSVPLPTIGDTYLWNFGDGTSNTQFSPSRVYSTPGVKTVTCTITNKYGCSRTLTTTITVPPKCFNGDIVAVPNPATVCMGNSVTLQYKPLADACTPTQYVWMNGKNPVLPAQNTPSITVSSTGFYWVKVKNTNCSLETPSRIVPTFLPLPTVTIKPSTPTTICQGDTDTVITATANNAAIYWAIDGVPQPNNANMTSLHLNTLAVGTHNIAVTAYSFSSPYCSNTTSTKVVVVANPAVPVITMEVVCITPYHVNLHASSNASGVYNWSNGMSGQDITVYNGGPIKVTVNNGNGCSASAQTDIPKNPEAFMWVFPTGCVTQCERNKNDSNIIIGPRLPLHYWAWYMDQGLLNEGANSFADPISPAQTGVYNFEMATSPDCNMMSPPLNYTLNRCEECKIREIRLESIRPTKGIKHCSFDVSVIINASTNMPVTITAPNNNVIVVPTTLNLTAGTAAYNFTIIPISPFTGGATVQLQFNGTTAEGQPCMSLFSFEVPRCEAPSSKTSTTQIVIAPNPAKESVAVQYEKLDANSTIELYDLTGRLLNNTITTDQSGVWNIETNRYPKGIYLIVTKTAMGEIVKQQKLILE